MREKYIFLFYLVMLSWLKIGICFMGLNRLSRGVVGWGWVAGSNETKVRSNLRADGLILLPQFLMVIIFKIWQQIICSSKFSLNWPISSLLYIFSTKGGGGVGVRPLVGNSTKSFFLNFA